MAARKKANHDQRTRDKIRTSQLINRLEKHILGEVEMTSTQVTAALGLIKKTLPDLSATQLDHTSSDDSMKPSVIKLIAGDGS